MANKVGRPAAAAVIAACASVATAASPAVAYDGATGFDYAIDHAITHDRSRHGRTTASTSVEAASPPCSVSFSVARRLRSRCAGSQDLPCRQVRVGICRGWVLSGAAGTAERV